MKLSRARLGGVAVAGLALVLSVSCSSGKAPLTIGSAAPKSAAPAAQRVLNVNSGASGQFTLNWNPIGVGITPLNVTHDLATARHFASTILVMLRGRIVERGEADEVILLPAHEYTRRLAAAAPDPYRV